MIKKIVFVGDFGVGKTSLLDRLLTDTFYNKYTPTQGVNVHPIHINNGFNIFNIWDCADQEKYGKLQETYWCGIDGIVIMFDLTALITWNSVPEYIKKIRKIYPNVQIIICGNKSDSNLIKIHPKKILRYCNFMQIHYCEISVKNNINCQSVLSHFI
jgi:GTP-binding nuclear protein Ran